MQTFGKGLRLFTMQSISEIPTCSSSACEKCPAMTLSGFSGRSVVLHSRPS